MSIDAVCEARGGYDKGNTPINEEFFLRPTPMSLYYGVFKSGTLLASFVMALGVTKYN